MMDMWESRLQQRGPPTSPIAPSAEDVILFDNPHASFARGVEPVTIDTNIPALTPAPQAPQKRVRNRRLQALSQISGFTRPAPPTTAPFCGNFHND